MGDLGVLRELGGVGGYCLCDHAINFREEGGVLVEGVFDFWVPFASFEFV